MAEMMQGGDAQLALAAAGPNSMSGKLEEPDHSSANWYFSREEIEKNSPSRKDGIDLKKETYFRKSYCTFLQDLGMRLKVWVFSHLFCIPTCFPIYQEILRS
jgi:cyclin T